MAEAAAGTPGDEEELPQVATMADGGQSDPEPAVVVPDDDAPVPDTAGDPDVPAPEQGTPPPAQSATKATWVQHAVGVHGVPEDQAQAMTKAELVEQYGAGAAEPEPAFYIADEDLFIGGLEGSGAMPARAYQAGDHVLPHDLDRYGWRHLVHRPDDTESE